MFVTPKSTEALIFQSVPASSIVAAALPLLESLMPYTVLIELFGNIEPNEIEDEFSDIVHMDVFVNFISCTSPTMTDPEEMFGRYVLPLSTMSGVPNK